MNLRKSLMLMAAVPLMAGCLDETGGMAAGGGAGIGGGGGAPGDEVFSRDEKGCLYQRIDGNLLPIVDASGRQQCDRLG